MLLFPVAFDATPRNMRLLNLMKPTISVQFSRLIGGVFALLIVACLLIPSMGEYSMWYDEVQVFNAADQLNAPTDLYQLEGFPARIVHPPLFFVALKVWMTLTGTKDFALRALPALAAILTAAFIYRITLDLSQRAAGGFAAAVIFGGMGFAVYYIHEVHNYSLLMTETAMLLFFYYRWSTFHRRRYSLGVVIATWMLIYTNYASIYIILAFTLYTFFAGRRQILRWIRLQVIVGISYVPWLPVIYWLLKGGYAHSEASGVVATSYSSSLESVGAILRLLFYDGGQYYAVLLLLVGLAAAIHPIQSRAKVLRGLGFLIFLGGVSLLLALLGNTIWQMLAGRRVIYLLVFAAVLLGYGFAHLSVKWSWGVLILFFLVTPDQPLPIEQPGDHFFRQAIEYVAANARPGDAVYLDYSAALQVVPFRHYAEQLLPTDIPFQTADASRQDLMNTYLPRDRIWVIGRQGIGVPRLQKDPTLQQKHLIESSQQLIARFNVRLLSIPAERPIPALAFDNPAGLSLPQVFGGQVELSSCAVDKLSAKPGEALKIDLEWRATQPMHQEWSVFLHLTGDDFATLVGQGDDSPRDLGETLSPVYWPVGSVIYDQHTLLIDPATPPGIYNLRLGLYLADQGTRLSVQPGDGVSASDGVVIAKIRVQ
jgi:Dolichyl-phosphate-mannose-protein mannosyltransferase